MKRVSASLPRARRTSWLPQATSRRCALRARRLAVCLLCVSPLTSTLSRRGSSRGSPGPARVSREYSSIRLSLRQSALSSPVKLSRRPAVSLIWDRTSADQVRAAAVTAQALGFEPRRIELEGHPVDYGAAFAVNGGPDEPVIIPASPIFLRDRAEIERLLLERRIPSVAAFRELAEAGALMSYGADLVGLF